MMIITANTQRSASASFLAPPIVHPLSPPVCLFYIQLAFCSTTALCYFPLTPSHHPPLLSFSYLHCICNAFYGSHVAACHSTHAGPSHHVAELDQGGFTRMSRHRAPILKKIVTRPRYILVLLLSLVLVSYHLRTAQLLRQRRIMISELQRSVYSSTEERRPTCDWTEWHVSRYASLKSNFASSSPIFLAINLYNNEQVLPTFYQELPILLEHLGPQQVYVSIYENGSSDMTPELLHKRTSFS